MHWRRVEVEFHASSMVNIGHVILKPSPGLGRLRVVGLASQLPIPIIMCYCVELHNAIISLSEINKRVNYRSRILDHLDAGRLPKPTPHNVYLLLVENGNSKLYVRTKVGGSYMVTFSN